MKTPPSSGAINHVRIDATPALHRIVFDNGRITRIEQDSPDAPGFDGHALRAIPGLVDIHAHGAIGHDTMDGDFAPLCRFLAEHGTTSWLATTMTASRAAITHAARADRDVPGTEILGLHIEGPFISPKKKGAQNEADIRLPDLDEIRSYPGVRMITIAPEIDGALEFIRNADPAWVIALGHTVCDEATARQAYALGARSLTHIYNAMPPLLHRAPGPVGAALTSPGATVQLISDGLHVAPSVVFATYKMFGPDRITLISDSISPAGLADGDYVCGGLPVRVVHGEARLHDGTLAGSSATLWHCVRKATEFGIPFEDALRMATRTPADLLGVPKGRLEPGFDADILLIDDALDLHSVFLHGTLFR